MLVYTAFDRRVDADPEQAGLLRLFDLSWERAGWKTRVVLVDTPFRPGRPFRLPEIELQARRARNFVPWWYLNLGSAPQPCKTKGIRCIKPDGVFIVEVRTLAEAEELFTRHVHAAVNGK